jgi:hypothetical protein
MLSVYGDTLGGGQLPQLTPAGGVSGCLEKGISIVVDRDYRANTPAGTGEMVRADLPALPTPTINRPQPVAAANPCRRARRS